MPVRHVSQKCHHATVSPDEAILTEAQRDTLEFLLGCHRLHRPHIFCSAVYFVNRLATLSVCWCLWSGVLPECSLGTSPLGSDVYFAPEANVPGRLLRR